MSAPGLSPRHGVLFLPLVSLFQAWLVCAFSVVIVIDSSRAQQRGRDQKTSYERGDNLMQRIYVETLVQEMTAKN